MSKQIASRVAATLAAVMTLAVLTATRALAFEPKDPRGGSVGEGPPPRTPVPPESALNWPMVVVAVVAAIAVAGLVYSLAWRHSHQQHQHA